MAYELVKCTCNYGTVDADKDGHTQAIHCPHCYQYRKLGAPLGFKVVEKSKHDPNDPNYNFDASNPGT